MIWYRSYTDCAVWTASLWYRSYTDCAVWTDFIMISQLYRLCCIDWLYYDIAVIQIVLYRLTSFQKSFIDNTVLATISCHVACCRPDIYPSKKSNHRQSTCSDEVPTDRNGRLRLRLDVDRSVLSGRQASQETKPPQRRLEEEASVIARQRGRRSRVERRSSSSRRRRSRPALAVAVVSAPSGGRRRRVVDRRPAGRNRRQVGRRLEPAFAGAVAVARRCLHATEDDGRPLPSLTLRTAQRAHLLLPRLWMSSTWNGRLQLRQDITLSGGRTFSLTRSDTIFILH